MLNDQESLAYQTSAALALKWLRLFTLSRKLYPTDLNDNDALLLHETMVNEIERLLAHPSVADLRAQYSRPHFENLELPKSAETTDASLWSRVSSQLSPIKSEDALGQAVKNMPDVLSDAFRKAIDRIRERVTFDCKIPHPDGQAVYQSAERFFFLIQQYWPLYDELLGDHCRGPISWSPHPLLRHITNLQYRLRRCSDALKAPGLSAALEAVLEIPFDADAMDVFEEYVQPRITAVHTQIEREMIKHGSARFDLTLPELMFMDSTRIAIDWLEQESHAQWKETLKRADATMKAAPAARGPLSCFETIGVVERVLRDVVKDRYQKEFGSRWHEEVRKTIDPKAWENIEKTMHQRHVTDMDDLIEYTQLNDVHILISQPDRWRLFQPLFAGARRDAYTKLMSVILKGRTEEAHNRPEHLWPINEKRRVCVACNDLLELLGKTEELQHPPEM